jgi:hypothetical protein
MTETGFTTKERLRFRKLLEVAHSTTYSGEREAAMSAATRLAASHGMSLREAAGATDHVETEAPAPRPHQRRPSGFPADFGAAGSENIGTWWKPRKTESTAAPTYRSEIERVAAEKERLAEAMADAVLRGLDAEERAKEERARTARSRMHVRSSKRSAWRARPEFIRVLLTETCMSAKEIASVAGVTIYDVFREKLLMRRAGITGEAL